MFQISFLRTFRFDNILVIQQPGQCTPSLFIIGSKKLGLLQVLQRSIPCPMNPMIGSYKFIIITIQRLGILVIIYWKMNHQHTNIYIRLELATFQVTGAQVAKLEYHDLTVRDCSWHPFYPMLVSSSWDGTIVRWEFSGNGEVPILEKKKTRRRYRY